jgi:hypothetical protein
MIDNKFYNLHGSLIVFQMEESPSPTSGDNVVVQKKKNTTMQEGAFIHYYFCFAFGWPCVCESFLFTN